MKKARDLPIRDGNDEIDETEAAEEEARDLPISGFVNAKLPTPASRILTTPVTLQRPSF